MEELRQAALRVAHRCRLADDAQLAAVTQPVRARVARLRACTCGRGRRPRISQPPAAAKRLDAGARRHELRRPMRSAARSCVGRRGAAAAAPDITGVRRASCQKHRPVLPTLKLTPALPGSARQASDAQPLWNAAEVLLLRPDTTLAVREPPPQRGALRLPPLACAHALRWRLHRPSAPSARGCCTSWVD